MTAEEKKRKKKKQSSVLEAELFRIMEKSLKAIRYNKLRKLKKG